MTKEHTKTTRPTLEELYNYLPGACLNSINEIAADSTGQGIGFSQTKELADKLEEYHVRGQNPEVIQTATYQILFSAAEEVLGLRAEEQGYETIMDEIINGLRNPKIEREHLYGFLSRVAIKAQQKSTNEYLQTKRTKQE